MNRLVTEHQPAGVAPGRGSTARPGTRFRLAAFALGAWAVAAGAGCGKKGPPLPPIVSLPAAVQNLAVRRLGSEVILRFEVPASNTDGTRPADLVRVEIHTFTGPSPGASEVIQRGTRAVSIDVRRPPPPGEDRPAPAPVPAHGVEQGATAVWSAMLTPEDLAPPPLTKTPPEPGTAPPAPAADRSAAEAAAASVPAKFYVAFGINRAGQRGTLSPVVGVPLGPAPPNPTGLRITYGPDRVSLLWSAGEPSDSFNVYQVERAASAEATASVPAPLNSSPVPGASFEDPRVVFGKERCYAVRAVRVAGELAAESDPSPAACVTPVDTFPPAAPRALAAVASENAVNLIWEPNAEGDLAGYLVLRGEAPGEKLAIITPAPIRETTFHDTTARRGVTYVYAVEAVDAATPPNVSDQSNRVEETIR